MKALDRKLVRDLFRLRAQGVSIALVIACGIACLVSMATAYRSLDASRQDFYARAHLADLVGHLDRAPRSVLDRVAALPGVARVEGRVVHEGRLERLGDPFPLRAHFVSLEGHQGSRLNDVVLRSGRMPVSDSAREAVVNELFARAQGVHPGDALTAVLGGRRVALTVVGIGVSPEFVWTMAPGATVPDIGRYAVVWMDGRALAHALDLAGAFNDLAVALSADARPAETASRIDALLVPYGATGVVDRAQQPSNKMLQQKIDQIRSESRFVPVIFLAVAGFLLHLVLSRIVGTQREQIATLKALGYSNGVLVRHYVAMALSVCALGAVLGVSLGAVAGNGLVTLFGRYYNLPETRLRVDLGAVAAGLLVSVAAGVLGAVTAVLRTVRLPAAEAMQPAPPEHFRPTVLERLGIDTWVGVAGRMVLRDLARRPGRLALSALAVGLGTSIMVVGSAMTDSLARVMEVQFTRVQREDLSVGFDHPLPRGVIASLARIPGVTHIEGLRAVPVRLRVGSRWRELALVVIDPDSDLRPFLDGRGDRQNLPRDAMALSAPLGDILGVSVGDTVTVEDLEAGRRTAVVRVGSFIHDLAGLSAYVDRYTLDRVQGGGPAVTGAVLSVAPGTLPEVIRRMARLPAVASLGRPEDDRQTFATQEADVLRSMQGILALCAAVIAVGVVFNNARIALAVRSRDLATLRILGFTRGEVALVLLGEQAVQLVLGVAVGLPLGRAVGGVALKAVPAELFRLPLAMAPGSYAVAAGVVLAAGLASALWVRREANGMDLVSVLKARD